MVAKGDHQLPIFPRVRVCDCSNLLGADAAAWIGKQRSMQSALDGAGFGWRTLAPDRLSEIRR
jgi:hypothetical protein